MKRTTQSLLNAPRAVRSIHTTLVPNRQPAAPKNRAGGGANKASSYPFQQRTSFLSGGQEPWHRPANSSWRDSNQGASPAPSSISPRAVVAKLQDQLQTDWIAADGEISRLAVDLGVEENRLKELAREFGKIALLGLRTKKAPSTTDHEKDPSRFVIDWELDNLCSSFISHGPSTISSAILKQFVIWAATLPLPTATIFKNPLPDPTLSKLHHLRRISDIRYPGEADASARKCRRRIILHVGPTNSGKTYQALVALARARTGVYAGPLRLLAHEVFSRFNEGKIGNEGKRLCNLITGEEQRILDPNATLSSCTVEMFPYSRRLDVGVIDEIQMIADPQRGASWTTAILAAEVAELHLCGEESVVGLIEKMAEELGDQLEVKRYQRLSPLVISEESLGGDLSKIRVGDCLVTFTRNNIFAYKKIVEEKTGLRVAVAYGGLPPEVREEQARVFNEGGYDVLVASDAVGMGLNLKIRRIVFETMHKWDGKREIQLPTPQIKQIAGRAGRYGVHTPVTPAGLDVDQPTPSVPPTVGEVTTLEASDLPLLRAAMAAPTIPVTQAVLQLKDTAYSEAGTFFPAEVTTSQLVSIVSALSQTSPHYIPASPASTSALLDAIQHVNPLSFSERRLFSYSPVNMRDPRAKSTIVHFAEQYAKGKYVRIEEWAKVSGLAAALGDIDSARADAQSSRPRSSTSSTGSLFAMEVNNYHNSPSASSTTFRIAGNPDSAVFNPETLATLESFHRCLTLYLWLSYRAAQIFRDQPAAAQTRKKVESAIQFVLEGMKFERVERKGAKPLRSTRLREGEMEERRQTAEMR